MSEDYMVQRYGRYQIVEELGRGSMGVVYKAYDPEIDRFLALKVLRRDRITTKAFLDRFMKEAKAIGRLSHPNIVTVYDVGQDHGTVFIAMELLEGSALSDVIKKEGRLDAFAVADIGMQVAKALEYAHKRGIIHRDIKPSNIIVDPEGKVKLTDFGIAHIEDPETPRQTQIGEILGTPAYMSPEQVMGRPVEGTADIFSLGVVLYEMATGQRPFKGGNLSAIFNAITHYTPDPPHKVAPGIPLRLSEIIMRCLSKDPANRFGAAGELAVNLKELKAYLTQGEAISPSRGHTKRRRLLKGAFIAIFIFIASGGYLAYLHWWPQASKEERAVATAILDVKSIPEGARLFVDGDFKGLTPTVLRLTAGRHDIRLSHEGYYPWEAQVRLVDSKTTPIEVRLIKEVAHGPQ